MGGRVFLEPGKVRSGEIRSLQLDTNNRNLFMVTTETGEILWARSVVVAPGRTPLIPEVFSECDPARVFHLTEFIQRIERLNTQKPLRHIVVLGGSQSAAELVLYLRDHYPEAQVSNVMRGYGYRLKDTREPVYFQNLSITTMHFRAKANVASISTFTTPTTPQLIRMSSPIFTAGCTKTSCEKPVALISTVRMRYYLAVPVQVKIRASVFA